MDTVQSEIVSICHRPEIQKKWIDRPDRKKVSRNPTFFPFSIASHYEDIKDPSFRLATEFASPGMTHLSGKVIGYG